MRHALINKETMIVENVIEAQDQTNLPALPTPPAPLPVFTAIPPEEDAPVEDHNAYAATVSAYRKMESEHHTAQRAHEKAHFEAMKPRYTPGEGYIAVPCPQSVEIGWKYDGTNFSEAST